MLKFDAINDNLPEIVEYYGSNSRKVTCEWYIDDRWGEQVFKTDGIGIYGGWDDSFKQTKCRSRAYVWGIFVDGKEVERGDTDVDKSRKLFSCKSFL